MLMYLGYVLSGSCAYFAQPFRLVFENKNKKLQYNNSINNIKQTCAYISM